jgi:glycyl-tRNA synthetase
MCAVWAASGHINNFTDPLSECRTCNRRVRADKLIAEVQEKRRLQPASGRMTLPEMGEWLARMNVACPYCGAVGGKGLCEPREANLLFSTHVGPMPSTPVARSSDWQPPPGEGGVAYLRPETAQGAYVQFKNVVETMRSKLPFGVCGCSAGRAVALRASCVC